MLKEIIDDKKVYDFAIKTYRKLKTSTYEDVFIPHTIYEMVQLAFDIEIGQAVFKDFKEILVNLEELKYVTDRVYSPLILGSIIYARIDMLKEKEIDEYIKADIDRWFSIALERLIQVTKEKSILFEGEAKSIEIKSNNLICTPNIKIDDEVEQILEITENGKVNFKSYKYSGKNKELILERQKSLTIFKGLIKELMDIISGLFSQEYQDADDLIKENAGLWEVKIKTEKDEYCYTGNLGKHLKYRGENVSEKIRSIINIENLLLFDNNKREDKIDRIEVEYKRVIKDFIKPGKDLEHFESLAIDRKTNNIEHKKRIKSSVNNEINIIKTYMIEQIIENTLDNFNSEAMFTKIEGNSEACIINTNDIREYSAIITFESGKTREIKGSYDKKSLPEDWEDFIGDIIAILAYFDVEEIFNDNIYNRNTRHKLDKIYLSVSFGPNTDRTFYYLTDNDDIEVGSFVIVPTGRYNEEKIARVENKEYFNELFVPFPLDRMKRITAIYEGEVGVDEESPLIDISYINKVKNDNIDNKNQDIDDED